MTPRAVLTPEMLSKERKKAKSEGGVPMWEFANILGLRNHESLWRLEKGKRPISRKLERRFWEWKEGGHVASIVAKIMIPSGTILPDTAEIVVCEGCNRKFIRMHKRQRFHHRNCQARAWRRKVRNNGR